MAPVLAMYDVATICEVKEALLPLMCQLILNPLALLSALLVMASCGADRDLISKDDAVALEQRSVMSKRM